MAVSAAFDRGATLLRGGVDRSWVARKVMGRMMAHGTFSNAHDDLGDLRSVLSQHLTVAVVNIVCCVTLFYGTA